MNNQQQERQSRARQWLHDSLVVSCLLLACTVLSIEATPLPQSTSTQQQQQQHSNSNDYYYPSFVSPVTGSRVHWKNHNMTSHRQLRIGDFNSLNELFEDAIIDIPFRVEEELPGNSVLGLVGASNKLIVEDIQCERLMLGDLLLDVTSTGAEQSRLQLSVVDLDFDCHANYKTTLLDHSGSISVYSRGSDVDLVMQLEGSPTAITARVEECHPNVQLLEVDFSRDSFLGTIADLMQGVVKGPIEDELNRVVREELTAVGDRTLPGVLSQLTAALDPYLNPLEALEAELFNPLYDEDTLKREHFMAPFINFQQVDNSNATQKTAELAHFVLDALDEVDAWLGADINDGQDEATLGINLLLRDLLLDDTGAFYWDTLFSNIELLSSHDELLDMLVTLDGITVRGLDSMTRFDTLQRIGQHTLQNSLAWRYLEVTANLRFDIKPSRMPDTLWSQVRQDMELMESNVTLTVSAQDVQVMLSILMAIHQERLGKVPLGGLMQLDTVLNCGLSTVQPANLVAGFDLQSSDLIDPIIDGFSSEGLNRVLTEVMDLLYDLYENWVLRALPNYAQSTIRDTANEKWKEYLEGLEIEDPEQACPVKPLPLRGNNSGVHYIDFRDLLLPAVEAVAMGGTGMETYGDVVPKLFELLRDQLLVVDEGDLHGRLKLNALLLDPLTEAQSGTRGMLHFPANLVSFVVDHETANGADDGSSVTSSSSSSVLSETFASLFEYLEIRLYDAKVRNINTVMQDTKVLGTSNESPYLLKNHLQFGPIEGRSLNASMRVLVGVKGNASDADEDGRRLVTDEKVEHIMDFSMSATSLTVVADLLAMVDASALQNFHLQNIANPHCWLATIPAPALSEDGMILSGSNTDRNLGTMFDAFVADFQNLALDMSCVNEACAKGGLGALQELSRIWEQSNVTSLLGERYELLATDLVTGDYMHNQIARWLDEAPSKCPHTDEQSTARTDYPPLDLPTFSSLSIDTMVFSALAAAQAGLVAITGGDSASFLKEISADVPLANHSVNTERFIDFTDTDNGMGSLSGLISYIFSQANVLLGVNSEGEAAGNGDSSDSGINGIVKDMLDDNGVLALHFEDAAVLSMSNLQIRLNSLRLTGLDTFSHFNILEAVAPQLLQNSLRMEKLSLEVDLSVVSGSDVKNNAQGLVLSVTAEDIKASFPIFAAIDADKLDLLELGYMLDIGSILPCVFKAVEDIYMPSVELSVGKLTDIKVKGLLPESNAAFERSMSAITERFGGIDVNEFLDTAVQGVVNGILSSYKKKATCTNVILSPSRRRTEALAPSYLDFRDLFLAETMSKALGGSGLSPYGDLFRTVWSFVEDLIFDVDPATKLSSVNEMLIAPLTEALSNDAGSLVVSDAFVDVANRIQIGGLDAEITFRASDAKIQNLDTLGAPIELLAPVADEPYQLNNTASAGVSERPLQASVRLLLGLDEGDDTPLRNDLELSMDLHNVTVVLTALLEVVANEFATFPLGDILNTDCWLAKIPPPQLDKHGFRVESVAPSATLSELAASVSKMNLRATCFSCTSPGLQNFTTEGSEDIDEVMNRVFNYVADVLGGKFLQVQVDRALNHAAKRCPHSLAYDPDFAEPKYATFESEHDSSSTTFLLMILIVTGILVAVLTLVALARRCFVRARHRRLLKSLPDRQLYLLQKEQETEDKREKELNAVTRSLFLSSATIPAYIRVLVPIVILGNIGLFLSGHLSLGATVNIEAQLAGEIIRIEEFFSFSMAQSTIDIWNAGGRALAALIFIFSGIWPYTKQIITLVLWFSPPSQVSMTTRGSFLLWMDTLAKWSMIDIFVLLVSIAGFRVSIVSPRVDFLPENFYSVDLLVVPCWGLYANMIAQILSQISSHFIIHYHRRVVDHANRARRALFRKTAGFLDDNEGGSTEGFLNEGDQSTLSDSEDPQNEIQQHRLCEHAFIRPHSNNARLVTRGYVGLLLVVCSVTLSVLLVMGCILPSFSLEIMGILGVFVESGNGWNQAVQEQSVFTITEMLMDQAAFLKGAGNYIGLGTLSALLVLTVLIVPLIQTISLLVHWFAPMTRKTRQRMEVFLESCAAWQYCEVYLIATVVASWQLGPISDFMINAYCGSLDSTFDMLVYYGILNENDAQCFRVEASIENAAYFLAAGSVLLAILNAYIRNASRQYFRDIDNKSTKETRVPPEISSDPSHNGDNSTGAGTSTAFDSYVGRRPSVDSQGNSFNDEVHEGESLLGADPLAPPATDEVEDRWRRCDALEKIHPVPVLFTDKFRWTLQSQEDDVTSDRDAMSLTKGDPFLSDDITDTNESNSLLMKGDAPDQLSNSAATSSRDDDSILDGFVEVDIGGPSETFKDEVAKTKSLEAEEWDSSSEENSDTEMGHTYAMDMSVSTGQYESASFSLNKSDGSQSTEFESTRNGDDSVLLGPDTDDTFFDEGIPRLQSELSDFDRRVSEDPDELNRRLEGNEYDAASATEATSMMMEEEEEGDHDMFTDEPKTDDEKEEASVNQDVLEHQPIRLEGHAPRLPENNPRRSQKGHSKLQAAFLA